MSAYLPNYCGPHDQRFSTACLHCSGEWFGGLTRVEQALVVRVTQPGVPYIGCKQYIEDFRKMEVVG
jgi:hypothetical protein